MITYLVLLIILTIIKALLSPLLLFNDVSLSINITNAIHSTQTWFSSMNSILPIDTLIACLGIIITIELAVLTYKLIKWVYKKIPGIS